MNEEAPFAAVVAWSWRLLPLTLLLAAWALAQSRDTGEAFLPVTVTSIAQDWNLAVRLTGRPL